MNFSEMLVRLFTLVLEASLAAAILTLIVYATERVLCKRLSAAWRFAIYLPVLLRLLLPIVPQSPTSILNFPNWMKSIVETQQSSPTPFKSGEFTPAAVSVITSQDVPARAEPMPIAQKPVARISPIQFFAMLWLAGSLTLLARLGIGALGLSRRLKREKAASPELIDLLEKLRVESGTRWTLRFIETAMVQTPCLFGLFRPRLLLPAGFADRLSTAELSHVMLHELAHLKRGDLVINSLMAIAQAVHWFNPFVWLLFRRMRLLRELACDRLVLEMRRADSSEAKAYGETLLKLINGFNSSASASMTIGILENEQSAKMRLWQIATFVPRARQISVVGIVVLCVLLLIGLSNAESPRIQTPADEIETAPTSTAKPEEPSSQDLKAERHAANIATLEREYIRAKKEVDQARAEVDRLVNELGIVIQTQEEQAAGVGDGSIQNSIINYAEMEKERVIRTEQLRHLTALFEQLKKMTRKDQRKALPTCLEPPDATLNTLLADYNAAEQKYALLSGKFSDGHPEVATAREVIKVIDRQIEHRIDGILLGLEARVQTSERLVKALRNEAEEARAKDAEKRKTYMPYFDAKRSLDHAQRQLDTIFMRLLAEKVDAKVPASNQPLQRFE